jgi:hypothetical protein
MTRKEKHTLLDDGSVKVETWLGDTTREPTLVKTYTLQQYVWQNEWDWNSHNAFMTTHEYVLNREERRRIKMEERAKEIARLRALAAADFPPVKSVSHKVEQPSENKSLVSVFFS